MEQIGAVLEGETLSDVIVRMKIGRNTAKEQVLMECILSEKAKQVHLALCLVPATRHDEFLLRVTHCDANYMKDDRIPIFISHVRGSIDVRKYLIDLSL